ncbi:RNA-directed DNA polymerase from mobile element jockey [Caerostris darwini]|uniref:RNA-directed DNA polymerase from mobile element jockey n=1 Tax=Caerostris darwini TaxID=1538125 RepID=A0AAV4WA63_9ARAC|nr:RNA-directed DNA polymerase from mobile element jockey [Caerostris darwini]
MGEQDLNTLLKELEGNEEIKSNFSVGKPQKRNPQIICIGVSEETTKDTISDCIKEHCNLDKNSNEIKVVNSFKGKRGTFHSSPKAAIIIKSSISSQILLNSQEAVIIMAQLLNKFHLIISIYCPPGKNLEASLEIIKPFILKYADIPILLLGDFNAKSRVWGQRDLDERGSSLLAFCQQQDLVIENSPHSPPTFSSSRGDSWIDLLVTKNINSEISMDIVDDISNSDHNLLVLRYSATLDVMDSCPKICINRLNWTSLKPALFKILNSNPLEENLTESQINSMIRSIQENIIQDLSPSNKPSSKTPRRTNAIWWTRELRIKRSKTRALRRLFQKEKEPVQRASKRSAFKKSQAEYKKLILHTKRNKFKEFLSSITNSTIFGNTFNIITNKKKRSSIQKQLIKTDGSLTNNIDESIDAILDHHFPWTGNHPRTPIIPNHQDFIQLTSEEIEAVISKLQPKKAVGTDGIPGEIVKEIFFANRIWFTELLNQLLCKGIFPQIWKIARIVLLDKEGKDLNHPSHFRPICILLCWGKVLDKIIAERLSYHLEDNKLINENQYGFRKNKSTILAINNIINFNNSAVLNNRISCLLSTDMSNAFNSVDWTTLKEKISKLIIPAYLKNIIYDFLHNREAILMNKAKRYNKGIPQGSCLGPILWNIYINDLL